MKKRLVLITVLFVTTFVLFTRLVYAEDCKMDPNCDFDSCQKKINECLKLIQVSVSATKPHEQKMEELQNNITAINGNVTRLNLLIDKHKTQISNEEKKLANEQESFEEKVRDYYQKNYQFGDQYFYAVLFSNSDTGDTVRNIAYRQNLINKDKQAITNLVLQIIDLNSSKKKLEENQANLALQKKNLEVILAPIKKLVDEAKAYQGQLSKTAAGLSARQQALLAEKTGNFQTSVGEVPDTEDSNSSIDGFRRNAPGGSFAGFSFGAPHRKGMSQYGAYGRAKSGQNAEEILRAYYGTGIEIKKDYSTDLRINVQGFGSYNIEDYVKRIYEVPNSWADNGGFEALKAQAVAARSYALAYTNNGSGSICHTESCQVFQAGAKGGKWEEAVNATRGWVLIANGKPLSSWYAAVSGGYTTAYSYNGYSTPGEWDTKCGNQGCWTNDAYEKIAGAPWFYKAWYKPRGSAASRSNAWLSKDEFVDIVNAVLVYQKDNGNISHLSQTDKSNSDTWSRDEVRNRLGGEAVSEVNSISATYSTGGFTNKIHIETDKGSKDINGETFRQIFNMRAPGEIWLASSLYNIEKK